MNVDVHGQTNNVGRWFLAAFGIFLAACSITEPALLDDDPSADGAANESKRDASQDRSPTSSGATSDGMPATSDRAFVGYGADAGDAADDGDPCNGVTCGGGTVCKGGRCVDACDGITCPLDKRCVGGMCEDGCTGVTCPSNQKCAAGKCEDACVGPTCACASVTCPSMQKCVSGACQPNCMGVNCPTNQKCDTSTGGCIALCAGVSCPGAKCDPSSGSCVALCSGVSCSTGQKCDTSTGACVALCSGVSCSAGQKCDTSSGGCVSLCAGVSCGANLQCDTSTGNCVDVCANGGNGNESHCCTDQGCGSCEKCVSHMCQKEANEDVKHECTGTCKSGVCNGQGACANSTNNQPGPGCTGGAITCQSAQFCSNGSCTRSNAGNGSTCGTCGTCNSGTCVPGAIVTCYKDSDGDGFGNPGDSLPPACGTTCPPGYVSNNGDCCDTDNRAYPNAPDFHQQVGGSPSDQRYLCGGWDFNCSGKEELQYPTTQNNCSGNDFAWTASTPPPCGSTVDDGQGNFGCPCKQTGPACRFEYQGCK